MSQSRVYQRINKKFLNEMKRFAQPKLYVLINGVASVLSIQAMHFNAGGSEIIKTRQIFSHFRCIWITNVAIKKR